MSTLEQTLGISGISIVLLFAAMAVIWGLMALMGRIPAGKEKSDESVDELPESPAAVPVPQEEKTSKAKAAVAAVAAALALRSASSRRAPKAGTAAAASPWQAAQRANTISRRNQLTSRK